jgi:hypothetical protein
VAHCQRLPRRFVVSTRPSPRLLTSHARVKKEPDALAPPSSKKTWRLAEDTAFQLEYQAADDPEEFYGLKAAELASFNEVQPGTLDFVLTWSRQDTKKADAERARRLGLYANLEDDDDAGPSQWRGGDNGQGCSTWTVKNDTPSDDDDDDRGDYDFFYQRLGMQ